MLEFAGIILWMVYITKVCMDSGFRALRYNIFVLTLWIALSLIFKTIGYFVEGQNIVGAELINITGFLLTIVVTYTIIFTDIKQRRKSISKLLNI